ncbi:hypothetical protein [Pseudobdellovibrio exovorus]|uniref:Uncharacterized protein n=1 Tax=Pseudobdellovibrio exovorus JSS TaxID=1184267 RepID=M4V635_9BACT|nr:hypothetical protein [Pseudobdellovibrio exovorus]AGH94648.1 hypothetical protein A11Q_428 [Pseudobdellovibrio exovorus JSS]
MTKVLTATLATLMILASQSALATPGDIGCKGTVGGKLELNVLIGYNYHGQGAVLIDVTAKDDLIFSSSDVKSLVMANETLLSADSGSSTVDIVLKKTNDDGTTNAIMDIAISGGLKAYSVNLTCEM